MSSPSGLAVAVIGMPAVARALSDAGYALLDPDVDAADLRAVSEMMKRAERDGRRFVVISEYLTGNARPLVATRAARNPTVVLRGSGVESDAKPIAMAVAELTLPATIDEIMGALRAPAKGHPYGTVVISADRTMTTPASDATAIAEPEPEMVRTINMAEFDEFGDDKGADPDEPEPDSTDEANLNPARPLFADLLDFDAEPEMRPAPSGLNDLLDFDFTDPGSAASDPDDPEPTVAEPALAPEPTFDAVVDPPTAPALDSATDQFPSIVEFPTRSREGAVIVCLSRPAAHAVTKRVRHMVGVMSVSLPSAAWSTSEQDLRQSITRARSSADVVVAATSIDVVPRAAFTELIFDPTVAFFGMGAPPSDDVIDALLAQLLSWRPQPIASPENPGPTHPSPGLGGEVSPDQEIGEPADRLRDDNVGATGGVATKHSKREGDVAQ